LPQSPILETTTDPKNKQERVIVLTAIIGVVAIAWIYLLNMAAGMQRVAAMEVVGIKPWGPIDFVLIFLMWTVMMIGMMIPGATPAILNFAALSRERRAQGETYVPTTVFVLGYLAVWTAFSVLATTLQWALNSLALLSPMMVMTSPILGGLVLVGAGIFQWTPIHKNFLARCRNPLEILRRRFGEGTTAFAMGLENGASCLGCCLVLMLLLFVGGVMNLLWVAVIAIFVLIEKALPYGDVCGRWTAVPLVIAGVIVMILDISFQGHVM